MSTSRRGSTTAAVPAASSAIRVERWPSPSIRYWVTRTARVYIAEGHARLAAARAAMPHRPLSEILSVSQRILILGGDGYLGWPTAMALSQAGHTVHLVDNFAKRQWELEIGVRRLFPIPTPQTRIPA